MAQKKILIDTNSYLRLAEYIHPLLGTPFGPADYCLYVIPELNDELKAHRLRTRFSWVDDDDYRHNRETFPAVGRKETKGITNSFEYIWDYVETDLPGPSRVDAKYLAYALELDIPVVTDDEAMIKLAKDFDIQAMRSLELLKIMLDSGHIELEKIDSIVMYWRHIRDAPGQLDKLYKQLFEKDPP